MPAGQQMQVQVIDRLSRGSPVIDGNAKPAIGTQVLTGDPGGYLQQSAQQVAFAGSRGIKQSRIVLLRDDQDVRRCDRADVGEGRDVFVLVEQPGGRLARNDVAKNAWFAHASSLLPPC
jgi:hypothetical protein